MGEGSLGLALELASSLSAPEDPESSLPKVSIIIPMRNEAPYIAQCLDSLLAGDYPGDRLEFLVIDGLSSDDSPQIVRRYADRDRRIRVLANPDRGVASALNIGLSNARHEVTIRVDAHATYALDYVSQSVRALSRVARAGGVAGEQRAVGSGYLQGAIAASMANPFASGMAKYRKTDHPCWVDTIYLGAWRTEVARSIGGFDPSWKVNEDYEYNIRLRQAGFGLLISPAIRSAYHPRATLWALGKQYCRYGFWRVRTIYAHPKEAKLRQFAAPLFIVLVAASVALLPTRPVPLLLLGVLYALASLVSSVWTAASSRWSYLPVLPLVFATMQFCWGIGFLAGVVRWLPSAGQLRRIKACAAAPLPDLSDRMQ